MVLALTASGSAVAVQPNNSKANGGAQPAVPANIKAANESLDSVAQLLAHAITDQALRQQIRARITTRGTPDKAVTLDSLSASSSISEDLAEAYSETEETSDAAAQTAVDQLTESLPPVQVSVPVKFASWKSTDVVPLVAYVPEGIDDMDLKTVTAYDDEGRGYELDAWNAPTQPVLVIGPDETAAHDRSAAPATRAFTPKQLRVAAASCVGVRLNYVRLYNDNEPWALGMAEIFMTAKSDGVWFVDQFPYLEMDGDQIWPNTSLGCTRDDVRFYWWEDDSGSADFTLGYNGVSFGISMSNDDDLIGGRQVTYSKFVGETEDTTDFGDLTMRTQ
ncbi:DUF3103 family protein [Nocardioides sp. InS609-2]|uniref:DUF3103 family protein n=1 Tax=Nocardioides sp. InS609-2 TaxID=2760705 RepID=UPI0020BEA5C1|nr:DUF3103 family protein [Nocardioides sp. InS609-2]